MCPYKSVFSSFASIIYSVNSKQISYDQIIYSTPLKYQLLNFHNKQVMLALSTRLVFFFFPLVFGLSLNTDSQTKIYNFTFQGDVSKTNIHLICSDRCQINSCQCNTIFFILNLVVVCHITIYLHSTIYSVQHCPNRTTDSRNEIKVEKIHPQYVNKLVLHIMLQ